MFGGLLRFPGGAGSLWLGAWYGCTVPSIVIALAASTIRVVPCHTLHSQHARTDDHIMRQISGDKKMHPKAVADVSYNNVEVDNSKTFEKNGDVQFKQNPSARNSHVAECP